MKFRQNLYKFMYHRYGADELYLCLFKLYFIIFIVNIFLNSTILFYLEFFLILMISFRFFSKNKEKRSRENKKYLALKEFIKRPINIMKRNYKDRNDYKYKRCNYCKKMLRLPLPSKIGIKHVKCPNCNKRITVVCLRKLKVEFVKG